MAVQILFRRGTASDWTSINPILGNGEPGFETDTGQFKIGDGTNSWTALPYVTGSGGGSVNLDGLTDVVITSPANGQVLKYNGTNWINSTDATGGGATNLDGLTDVVITSPSSGQVLKYNGTSWINDTDATGGGGGSGTVTSVSVASANGFSGTVTNASTTPEITISTGINGLLKGNGTGLTLAVSGSDYQEPLALTTTGSSGAATLIGNTLNIPQYSGGGGGATNLDELSDVIVTTPSNGQVLKYNGTNWVNAADATGSTIASLDDIPGVALTSPTTGQVLKFDGTNWINDADATGGGGATNLDELSDVVVTSPSNGQVLKFNGTSWVNAADATGSGGALDDLSDVVVTSPSNGQVLKFNGTSWVNAADATSSIFSRSTASQSTTSIADTASENIDITGFKSYALLKIETSAAAWVRLYSDAASRTADQSRLEGVDPLPGAGVIAEVITTGAQTIIITPGTIGFNNEATPTTAVPVRVTNKSGGTTSITVTLTLVQLEA